MNITQEGEEMAKMKVKVSSKKPTIEDVKLHQFLNFGKSYGVKPDSVIKYFRKKKIN